MIRVALFVFLLYKVLNYDHYSQNERVRLDRKILPKKFLKRILYSVLLETHIQYIFYIVEVKGYFKVYKLSSCLCDRY